MKHRLHRHTAGSPLLWPHTLSCGLVCFYGREELSWSSWEFLSDILSRRHPGAVPRPRLLPTPVHLRWGAHRPSTDGLLRHLVLLLLSNLFDVKPPTRCKRVGSCAKHEVTVHSSSAVIQRFNQEHQTKKVCLPGLVKLTPNQQRVSSPSQPVADPEKGTLVTQKGRRQEEASPNGEKPQEGREAWLGVLGVPTQRRAPATGRRLCL